MVPEPQMHILYTVLDWGLGHATRSIPVIRALKNKGVRISIAGNGASLHLLQMEFPELQAFEVPGMNVRYPVNMPLALALLMQLPRNLLELSREKKAFSALAAKLKPDAIISDNRYGAAVRGFTSVIITHQLSIRVPESLFLLRPVVRLLNENLLRRFSEVWVPDTAENPGLSGELSHRPEVLRSLNVHFTGPLSRLTDLAAEKSEKDYDVLVLLSGPEPQRTHLEKSLIRELSSLRKNILLVRGKPMQPGTSAAGNIDIVSHLPAATLKHHISSVPLIICRPGYSTLMDLAVCGTSAICIPTPGQTEQEYLADFHGRNKRLVCVLQRHITDLQKSMELLNECNPLPYENTRRLEKLIDEFLNRLGH